MKIDITKQLKAARMTQGALADAIGKSHGFLSEVLSGKKNPSVETLSAIAAALGVPVSDIIVGSSDTAPDGRSGMSESMAEPFRPAETTPIRVAVDALSRNRRRAETYRVRVGDLALALCAGDVLILDMGASPAPGSLVVATIADAATGAATTVVRKWLPGWLIGGTSEATSMQAPEHSVAVLGVVGAVIRA